MTSRPDYRSVLDFDSTDAIMGALMEGLAIDDKSQEPHLEIERPDWVLPTSDDSRFEKQSLVQETQRLSVLREYKVLDTENEIDYDQVTEEAGTRYNVPWACVSFVDMGRLWFKSMYKDDIDIKQTARQDSFCTYTLQCREDLFVVPDTHQDERFRQNPYVTGHPGWRFYAGVPLVSPEGAKLGTFCLLDRKPRPEGLSVEDEQTLRTMARRVMERLVERRRKLKTAMNKRPSSGNLVELAQANTANASASSTLPSQSDDAGSIGRGKRSRLVPSSSNAMDESQGRQASSNLQTIIRPPALDVILPNPNTAGVDPDAYLSQLVEALYGVKLQTKAALELKGFFPGIADEQMAAYDMEVVTAARENNLDGLRQICAKKGPGALDCFNRFGEGLLNLACRRGFKEVTFYLLSDVGLSARVRDDYGRTPLHDACWNPAPLLEICTWLLQKEPALFFVTDKRGFTPFQYARKSDWLVWRQFLFDRRHMLEPLSHPDVLKVFSS